MNTQKEPLRSDEIVEQEPCPLCESPLLRTWQTSSFTYGAGTSAVDLQARLPVLRCDACDEEFLDHDGEMIEHEAVCRHLGVLTPGQVRAVRKRRGPSRAAFAGFTGLGEATIKRWESGAVVQNLANDRYLRLLDDDSCWAVLERVLAARNEPQSGGVLHTGPWKQLAGDRTTQLRKEQVAFSPRRVAA